MASACSLGNSTYIHGGKSSNECSPKDMILNSIEKLDNPGASALQDIPHWQLINLPPSVINASFRALFTPINSYEIAILSGSTSIGSDQMN